MNTFTFVSKVIFASQIDELGFVYVKSSVAHLI